MPPGQTDDFWRRFRVARQTGRPKYAELRQALLAAIDAGHWKAGDKLPTELELTRLTPYSLGTVQRALRMLVDEGAIVRRQGHGSFVADDRREMEDPLHCQFLADDGVTSLGVFPRIVDRRPVIAEGRWNDYLGPPSPSIFRIQRVIDIGGEFAVWSQFYADARRLPLLRERPIAELTAANFKLLLRREMRLPVTHIEHTARVTGFPAAVCRAIGIATGTTGLVLEIGARSGPNTFIYYQELYIPPNARTLVIRQPS
jgi:DNA-binding GntR family transcriptional regulator